MSQSSKSCLFEMLLERARQERTLINVRRSHLCACSLSSATAPALLGWRLAFLLLLFVLPLFLLLLLCRYFFSISKWLQKLNTCFFIVSFIFRRCAPQDVALAVRRRRCVGSQVALADRASAIDKSITSCVLP